MMNVVRAKLFGLIPLLLFCSFSVPINSNILLPTNQIYPKYVIFDTDMGADDAWALQIVLNAERRLKSVKVLAITTVNGNTDLENVVKNTYRILDELDRTDVCILKAAVILSFIHSVFAP